LISAFRTATQNVDGLVGCLGFRLCTCWWNNLVVGDDVSYFGCLEGMRRGSGENER
jgi:hypothetical protein